VGLIVLDGMEWAGGGQVLRSALTLSVATGQAFRADRIRATRARPGLQPQHLAAVRAAAMSCGAEVHGAFDGSPDLRFAPRAVEPGDFGFDLGSAGPATLVLQTVVPALARGASPSWLETKGGTHLPRSPSLHFLARHWAEVVGRLGLQASFQMERAGFASRADGCLRAFVRPWSDAAAPLELERRGELLAVRGVSGWARVRGDVARRAADAAHALLWEQRRLESEWEIEEVPASSPGSFLQMEAVFAQGRAAFALLGERGVRAEVLGERAARKLLRFLEDEDSAVDPWLADQLAVPLALSRAGGRLSTSEVTAHLQAVAAVLERFSIPARTWGRRGGPGGLEVPRH
jgi:RNA 3'-terminal phosphate cyclase (ATP)